MTLCRLQFDGMTQWEIDAMIDSVVGHVDTTTRRAVLDAASRLKLERLTRAAREAATPARAAGLARATGCPDETSVVQWCEQHGLLERDDAGAYRLTARAVLRAV